MEMLVVRTDGPIVTVRDSDGQERHCVLRGRLRRELGAATNPVAVGDRVEVQPLGAAEGVVERVLPRRSRLARRAVDGHDRGAGAREQVLAANLDVAVIVVPCPPRPTVIDRYLALVAGAGCEPLVCANKIDLADRAAVEAALAGHAGAGVRVVLTSALTGQGVAELAEALAGKFAAFVGPSGSGKSSLINALDPHLDLRVGGLNVAGKGRHTTNWAVVYPLGSGFVVDTPGLREITFLEDQPSADDLFPEITALAGGCRFRDCSHTHEPRCAVVDALEAGALDPGVYRRYVRLARRDDPAAQARLAALQRRAARGPHR